MTALLDNAVLGGEIPEGLTIEEAASRAYASSKLFLETLNSLVAVLMAEDQFATAGKVAVVATRQHWNDEEFGQLVARLVLREENAP